MPITKTPQKQIIAIGGGGFSYTVKVTAIDKYILSLPGKQYPGVWWQIARETPSQPLRETHFGAAIGLQPAAARPKDRFSG